MTRWLILNWVIQKHILNQVLMRWREGPRLRDKIPVLYRFLSRATESCGLEGGQAVLNFRSLVKSAQFDAV